MCYFKTYCTLPEDAKLIRELVFMKEQGFTEEFDDTDAIAKHIVFYNDKDQSMATCRYFPDKENPIYFIGRIAVLKEFRKKNYGEMMLQEAERQIKENNASEIRLAAQVRAKGFYEKSGFSVMGNEFFEEDCPHIWMYKKI